MPPATGKFKPFPRVKDWVKGPGNTARPIDLALLKEQYLAGPDYEWADFCRRQNYNSKFAFSEMHFGTSFRDWKRDWIKNRANLQDDEIAPAMLDMRKLVTSNRIAFTRDWTNRTQYMKALMDATMRAHGEALQHDERHAVMIGKGEIARRFMMDAEDLGKIAAAAQRIQDIEMKALYMVNQGGGTQLPELSRMRDVEAEEVASGTSGDGSKPEFTIVTMGQAGLSAGESARLLAEWFDQAPKEAAKVVEAEETLPDAGD